MEQTPRIAIVEDDPEIRSLLDARLRKEGFLTYLADGSAALDRLLNQYGEPSLIVLDLMLPGEDGFAICRRLRATSRIPIIMLTARGEDIDRIIGLEMGADDYMSKPFNPRELVARIRAVLRRLEDPKSTDARHYDIGGLKVDLEARHVALASGEELKLTSAEFDLLECFIERPGRVLSRDQLMDWTRGRQAEALDRTIDVQVSRLRKKIEQDELQMIKTVRNAGYVLTIPVTPVKSG